MNVENVATVQIIEPVESSAVITDTVVSLPVEGEVMYQSWYKTISSYLAEYPSWVLDVGVFGVGALLLGVLIKNFGRYIIFSLIAAVVIMLALNHLHVITFSVNNLRQVLGLQDIHSVGEFSTELLAWSKAHVVACVSAIVGFLVGWQLG